MSRSPVSELSRRAELGRFLEQVGAPEKEAGHWHAGARQKVGHRGLCWDAPVLASLVHRKHRLADNHHLLSRAGDRPQRVALMLALPLWTLPGAARCSTSGKVALVLWLLSQSWAPGPFTHVQTKSRHVQSDIWAVEAERAADFPRCFQ